MFFLLAARPRGRTGAALPHTPQPALSRTVPSTNKVRHANPAPSYSVHSNIDCRPSAWPSPFCLRIRFFAQQLLFAHMDFTSSRAHGAEVRWQEAEDMHSTAATMASSPSIPLPMAVPRCSTPPLMATQTPSASTSPAYTRSRNLPQCSQIHRIDPTTTKSFWSRTRALKTSGRSIDHHQQRNNPHRINLERTSMPPRACLLCSRQLGIRQQLPHSITWSRPTPGLPSRRPAINRRNPHPLRRARGSFAPVLRHHIIASLPPIYTLGPISALSA